MYDVPDAEREVALEYLPPVIYLPVAQVSTPDGPTVEMRQLDDGRLALLAYTALDRLARCQGPAQPWILLPMENLNDINERQPYDVIYFDVPLDEQLRRGARY